jgi:hypothetical protein
MSPRALHDMPIDEWPCGGVRADVCASAAVPAVLGADVEGDIAADACRLVEPHTTTAKGWGKGLQLQIHRPPFFIYFRPDLYTC